jgi:hypothetical protein
MLNVVREHYNSLSTKPHSADSDAGMEHHMHQYQGKNSSTPTGTATTPTMAITTLENDTPDCKQVTSHTKQALDNTQGLLEGLLFIKMVHN